MSQQAFLSFGGPTAPNTSRKGTRRYGGQGPQQPRRRPRPSGNYRDKRDVNHWAHVLRRIEGTPIFPSAERALLRSLGTRAREKERRIYNPAERYEVGQRQATTHLPTTRHPCTFFRTCGNKACVLIIFHRRGMQSSRILMRI